MHEQNNLYKSLSIYSIKGSTKIKIKIILYREKHKELRIRLGESDDGVSELNPLVPMRIGKGTRIYEIRKIFSITKEFKSDSKRMKHFQETPVCLRWGRITHMEVEDPVVDVVK